MCLSASKVATVALAEKNAGKTITVYKAYYALGGVLRSPYRMDDTRVQNKGGTISGPGEIVSNRPSKNAAWKKDAAWDEKTGKYCPGAEIEKGIHVYLKREEAANELYDDGGYGDGRKAVVVALQADINDLVGTDNPESSSHTVFMKVTLSEDQFRKAIPLTDEEKAAKRSAASKKAALTRKRRAAGKKAAATRAAKKKAK